MKRAFGIDLVTFAAVALLCAAPAPAQRPAGRQANSAQSPPTEQDAREREQLERRWNSFTPEERERLRERYERLLQMTPEQRQELQARAKRFEELREQTYQDLPAAERARLDQLPAHKRKEILQELTTSEAREIGERIFDKLPAETRRRLESARPQDRIHYFKEFKRKQSERAGDLIAHLGSRLQKSRDEIRATRELGQEARKERLLEWMQELSTGSGAESLPSRHMERLRGLSPRAFFDAVLRMRDEHPELALALGLSPDGEARHELRRGLRKAMDFSVEEHLELSELSRSERKRTTIERRRSKALTFLREQGSFSEAELTELESTTGPSFFWKMRRLVGGEHPRGRGGREHGGDSGARQGRDHGRERDAREREGRKRDGGKRERPGKSERERRP